MSRSKNRSLFNKFLKKMNILKREKAFSDIYSALKDGKNSYMRLDRLESSNFDMVWIKRIEDCIYDIGEIVANPKEVTKTVTSIVPVELAKKIGSESVIHLASHTQYIKDITPEGDVIPNKILNIGAEEDIHTYENRFIATLIRRLVLFVEKRYEFVKKFAPLHDDEILYFKNKSIFEGEEIEIETKIKVRSESSTKMADTNNKYIERILKIREYILYFYGSKFMKELKTERDVRNPIVMTNILRKNPKYHKCYELYRFIEKYDGLGVSYKVDEDVADFSNEEINEMNTVLLANYLALKSKDKKKLLKNTHKQYKPKILTSLDDEEFVYGDLLKGPIEFMRVDQGYLDYLESQVKKDLPQHPTKLEKEYYKEEFQEKADVKTQKVAIEKLEKRKKKEQTDFDKKAKAMVALRGKEEKERIIREQEVARLEEEKRIEAVRRQLVEAAKSEQPPEPEEINEEEQEQLVIRDIPVYEEEAPVEEQPQEEVLPSEEPVIEESAPIEEEPIVEETPVEESVQETEPEIVEEQPSEEIVEEVPVQEEVSEEIMAVEEEPIVEEAIEDEEPQPEVIEEQPVFESVAEEEPQEEPASEEMNLDAIRALLIADAQEKPIVEETPVEEPQVEEQPQEEVLEETPVIEETPVVEETPVEEVQPEPEVVDETPKEEKPVRKPRAHRQPRKKHEPVKEEPVQEEQPVSEPEPEIVKEEPAPIEEPQIEEKEEISEEKPSSAEILDENKKEKAPRRAHKPKKEKPVKEDKELGPKLEPIPGRFIVKTNQGYFVSKNKYSVYKHDAWVFDDFNDANRIKNNYGGKVVKL